RAPAFATGLKAFRPDLQVWVITGDGDGLSIGGNHLIHAIRRNVDIKIILFNNEIYGLTKGQHSPTARQGTRTKSSPLGSIDNPLRPLSIAIGAEATFVARTVDVDINHLTEILRRASAHKGTAFVEIYQNCKIFNDGVFEYATDKSIKADNSLYLQHGKPLIFGKDRSKGIRLHGLDPEVVTLGNGITVDDLLIHDLSELRLRQLAWQRRVQQLPSGPHAARLAVRPESRRAEPDGGPGPGPAPAQADHGPSRGDVTRRHPNHAMLRRRLAARR